MTVSDADRRLLTDPPTLRMDSRVVMITGASRGLGRSLAFALAGLGADLLLCARSAESLEEVAGEIRAAGGVAETVAGSVADPEVIAAAMDAARRRWGRLDVLINNAGISTSFTLAERMDEADWRETLEVNLTAPFLTARAALALLSEGTAPSVINISSVHGARAHERLAAYAASKGGLELLTRTLAVEWAQRGIRVNSVAPGYIETDMTAGLRESDRWNAALSARTPLGRFATTAEIVPSVLLLATPDSTYTTGSTIYVDGGWTAL